MELGEFDLSGALQEVSVSLDERHGLDVLGSKNMALINSLHLNGYKYGRRNRTSEPNEMHSPVSKTEMLRSNP